MSPRTSFEPPYDAARSVVRIEADALARKHKLDPERVHRVMACTAVDAYGRPLPPPLPGRDTLEHGLLFVPSLDEALAFLAPEVALTVLERTDPATLARRCRLVGYLADPATPSVTLDELVVLLEAYAGHLERNHDALLTTGYPATSFAASPWLDWRLGLLSPTKVPVSAFELPTDIPVGYSSAEGQPPTHRTAVLHEEGLLPTDGAGNLVYTYTWTRDPSPRLWSRDGPFLARSFEQPNATVGCAYEDAGMIDGLTPEVARLLEKGRARLLEATLGVLHACARCADARDVNALWPSVVKILTDALLWDETQRLLAVEDLYWHAGLSEIVAPSLALRNPNGVPGTLSGLLEVTGHVEKEVRFGTLARTVNGVRDALSRTGSAGMTSYFQTVGRPGLADLDDALDGFWALEHQERAFWEEYRRRVDAALEGEFSEEVIVRTLVKRRLVARFEPQVRTFAEWQRASLEATGTLPVLQISSLSEIPTAPRNVFRQEGDAWIVTYDGATAHLEDSKGLRYLAFLLQHPGREFHVVDLITRVEGSPAPSNSQYRRVSQRERADLSLTVDDSGDLGSLLDPRAKAEIKDHLDCLAKDLEDTLTRGDDAAAEAIRAEQEAIAKYLAGAIGLRGRDRKVGSNAERARVKVTKVIGRALDRIAGQHPQLRSHLNAVTRGEFCSYRPMPGEDSTWIT